jgi:fido (protein-threonine AMPylation protein)
VALASQEVDAVVTLLATFQYRFAAIHPFVDGNGRLARIVIDQAARELLGLGVGRELTTNRELYNSGLRQANQGDLGPLEALVKAALG